MTRPRPELIALLDAAKDDPTDRTSWLVLTDWLEEHGDDADRARAEYCRLCFGKMGVGKVTAALWEQGERRRELFRQWGATWLGPLLEFRPRQEDGLFALNLTRPLQAMRADLTAHPEAIAWVYRVEDGLLPGDLGPDLTPDWGHVRDLSLGGGYLEHDAETLLAILDAPPFARLRRLRMAVPSMTKAQGRRLVEIGRRHPFREVRLSAWNSRVTEARRAYVRERLGDRVVF